MPVLRIQKDELRRLGVNLDEFVNHVAMLGADLKDVTDDEINVEFFPDRPDLYTVEGVARAIKSFLGYEKGLRVYRADKSGVKIIVDSDIKEIRPYIVGAIIRDVDMDEMMIKSMMNFQEKLHATVGRGRKKLAIGLHDFDKVKPPFRYIAMDKNLKFIPLGFSESMSLEEILHKHPKGVEYGHIISHFPKYPIILDSENNVLSFPPIINGTLTEITPQTRNIFVDMTGTHLPTLLKVLNIVVCSFADRGARIESVEVIYPDDKIITPQLYYETIEVDRNYVKSLLGMGLSDEEIKEALERMGFGVEIEEKIRVKVPPYRMDILHPVDIVEDIAKGYGYHKFRGRGISRYKLGRANDWDFPLRMAMVGLGFLEIKSLTLSSFRLQYDMMRLPRKEEIVVENPVSEVTETLRLWIIPSLLEILRKNKHRELPQKVFEISHVRRKRMEMHLGFAVIDVDADFTHSKSITERILTDMGIEDFEVGEKKHPSFIDGRCASVILRNEEIGFFGEIHPEVIENFELGYPVIAGELNLSKIKEIRGLLS